MYGISIFLFPQYLAYVASGLEPSAELYNKSNSILDTLYYFQVFCSLAELSSISDQDLYLSFLLLLALLFINNLD